MNFLGGPPNFISQYARVRTRSFLEGFGRYVKMKGKPDADPEPDPDESKPGNDEIIKVQ